MSQNEILDLIIPISTREEIINSVLERLKEVWKVLMGNEISGWVSSAHYHFNKAPFNWKLVVKDSDQNKPIDFMFYMSSDGKTGDGYGEALTPNELRLFHKHISLMEKEMKEEQKIR